MNAHQIQHQVGIKASADAVYQTLTDTKQLAKWWTDTRGKSHSNWADDTDFLAHCSTKWAVFLLSLKDLLEKGKGHPAPEDVPINHS